MISQILPRPAKPGCPGPFGQTARSRRRVPAASSRADLAMFDVGADLLEPERDIVGALQGLGTIVVAVTDEDRHEGGALDFAAGPTIPKSTKACVAILRVVLGLLSAPPWSPRPPQRVSVRVSGPVGSTRRASAPTMSLSTHQARSSRAAAAVPTGNARAWAQQFFTLQRLEFVTPTTSVRSARRSSSTSRADRSTRRRRCGGFDGREGWRRAFTSYPQRSAASGPIRPSIGARSVMRRRVDDCFCARGFEQAPHRHRTYGDDDPARPARDARTRRCWSRMI